MKRFILLIILSLILSCGNKAPKYKVGDFVKFKRDGSKTYIVKSSSNNEAVSYYAWIDGWNCPVWLPEDNFEKEE